MKINHKNIQKVGMPLVLLLVIVLGVIFLLSRSSEIVSNNNKTSDEIEQIIESNDVRVIPVENPVEAKLSNKVVTFDSAYYINTSVQANKASGVLCTSDTANSCIFDFVTNNSNSYYLAAPFESYVDDSLERANDVVTPLETKNGTINLKYAKLSVTDDSNMNLFDKAMYTQVFGCFDSGVCVGSGLLNINDLEANKAQVATFEDFVRSISIN